MAVKKSAAGNAAKYSKINPNAGIFSGTGIGSLN